MTKPPTKIIVQFPALFVLFLVFLTLKLTGVIAWSWWWVTAPLWGGIAAVLVMIGGIFALGAIVLFVRHILKR